MNCLLRLQLLVTFANTFGLFQINLHLYMCEIKAFESNILVWPRNRMQWAIEFYTYESIRLNWSIISNWDHVCFFAHIDNDLQPLQHLGDNHIQTGVGAWGGVGLQLFYLNIIFSALDFRRVEIRFDQIQKICARFLKPECFFVVWCRIV